MSLKVWAIKARELKPLSRADLILFSVRCALRVEPWVPADAAGVWEGAAREATQRALAEVVDSPGREDLCRKLLNLGAAASNRLIETDEPLGSCVNYAMETVATAVELGSMEMGSPFKKRVIEAAKSSASIPAILAHAGRVTVPEGHDAVDVACVAMWDEIRADILRVDGAALQIQASDDPLGALRNSSPLWVGARPDWVPER